MELVTYLCFNVFLSCFLGIIRLVIKDPTGFTTGNSWLLDALKPNGIIHVSLSKALNPNFVPVCGEFFCLFFFLGLRLPKLL